MLDRIIQWSLENRLVTLLAAVIVLAAGTISALTMAVDVFPDLTAPTVTVLTEAHGMAPEEVESLITFPIETAVNGAAGVRRVRSSSAQGISIVWVEFDWGTDILRARQIVSEKLQTTLARLPEEIDPPILAPISSVMGEIMLIGISSPRHTPMEVRSVADWRVRNRLLSIEGISQVIPIGGDVKEYQVRVRPEALRTYDIGLDEVLRAAEGASVNASGGIYLESGREILIRGIGRTASVEEIARTVVVSRDGVPITLGAVADVRIGAKPRIGVASVNAEPGVVLSIQKQPEANTLELTDRIDRELDRLQETLPEGMVLDQAIFRQANFISRAVENVIEALRDGAILVVIILFLFLWNFRTTGISVLAIPLSLSVAILAMRALGISINTMTLGGMAIAIGALVDDAIIDVENVFRRLRENRLKPAEDRLPSIRVIFEASREVRGPILNATLIITVVFIPLFFLSGVEGRLLQPLGFAYIVAILASLVVAVTVTPTLCSYLLPGAPVLNRLEESWLVERLKSGYGRLLERVLRVPRLVVVGAGILVLVTLALLPFLGRGFLPEFQEGTLVISAISVPGTGLEMSDSIGGRIERMLLDHPSVVSTSRRTGRAELDEHAQGSNAAEIEVLLDLSEREYDEVLAELRGDLDRLSGTNITIGQPIGHRIDHMLSGTRASIAVKIFGGDLHELRRLSGEIEDLMDRIPGVVDLTTEQQADVPQLRIYADRWGLATYGLTPGDLAEAIDVAFAGEVVGEIREGEEVYDLSVRYDNLEGRNIEVVRETPIATPNGRSVPLELLAEVRYERGPNTISRENVRRKIVISANVADRDVGSVVEEIRRSVDENVELPEGYYVEYGGQFESAREATRTILLLSLVSLAAIFLLLYREFRSTRTTLLVMVNLPLALTGGIAALFLFLDGELNVAGLVGFITLFGIAVRNGILLASHYYHLMREGRALYGAVVQGSIERLNPILMTALTAGLALIPLALGGGEPGRELQTPMAIVILGGLLTSTLLNMFVVPALFLQFEGDR